MSNFRYSRLAVSRLLTQLAFLALPDGESAPYLALSQADILLKARIKEVKAALASDGKRGGE